MKKRTYGHGLLSVAWKPRIPKCGGLYRDGTYCGRLIPVTLSRADCPVQQPF